jgi:hypothetical protein
MNKHRWDLKKVDVTGWEIPFDIQRERAVQIALDPLSLTLPERALIENGDLTPVYIRWWITVGDRLHVDHGKIVTLGVKSGRRWRSSVFSVAEFSFCELLTLLSEPRFQWGLGWGEPLSSDFRYDGCIVPYPPYGVVVAGTEQAVDYFLTQVNVRENNPPQE